MKKWILLLVMLLGITGIAQAIPDPSAVYCTLQGYEYEIRTDAQGNQYGVCVFPDGSECSAWHYYCKCEPNGIGCWAGDFSCHWPCKEMRCKEAGESVLVSKCCEGLDELYPAHIFDANCNKLQWIGWLFLCSDCGNGICESWESKCNCPEDCAEPRIIYVDADANGLNDGSSWVDAYNYLQDALPGANSGDEVRVAEGIYKPDQGVGITPGNRYATFQLINGVSIKGGYAGFGEPDPNARDIELYETILSGDLDGNDVEVNDPCDLLTETTRGENSYHVVTADGTDETAVFDGFTITAGNANGPIPDRRGGGMYNTSVCLKLTNCIFSENSARSSGGGMWNWGSFTTLTKCRFNRNSAGDGGGIGNLGNAKLTNCTFSGNSAYWGGGMLNWHRNKVTLTDCTFNGNSAMTGGGIRNMDRSNVILINCIFSGNSADENGGGMYCEGSCPTNIVNCTFSKNSAQEEGGGLYIPLPPVTSGGLSAKDDDDKCKITNCIFWENWPQQIVDLSGFRLAASYSDVQGGWAGEGSIDADPCFVDAENGDYHLLADSPCIHAGDPNYIAEPNETDLDGKPRVIGGRIDMGAYEFNHIPVADAGSDEEVYAWIDGIAEVTLDGTGSYDEDDQPLTYLWSWTVDSNTFTETDPNATIELPVGEHIIELIVNDGIDDSEPNQVVITVIEPMEAHLWMFPRVINRYSRESKILALLRLPEGVTRDQIDSSEPLLLYPAGSEAIRQYVIQYRRHGAQQVSIFAFFDKGELMAAVPGDGSVELQVVGELATGRYFYGTDTVRIIGRRRMPRRSLRGRNSSSITLGR